MLATFAAFLSGQKLDGTYDPQAPGAIDLDDNDGFPLEAWSGH